MGTVAVFQMHCCARLFIAGRYSGNLHSSSGYYPKYYCPICCIPLPRPNAQQSNCSFVGYWFEDKLQYPMKGGVAVPGSIFPRRYLSIKEVINFRNSFPPWHKFTIMPSEGIDYEFDMGNEIR